jgi:hypothetical protein
LFVKYVSDKYANDPNGLIKIPKGGSFKDMQALKERAIILKAKDIYYELQNTKLHLRLQ